MKHRSAARYRQVLFILAAVTGAIPAAAQEQPPEPSLESRDTKAAEAWEPSTNLVIQGVSNGLQVRVLSRGKQLAPEGAEVSSCSQDCELKLRTGPYTLVANQGERQSTQDVDLASPVRLTVGEPNVKLVSVGTVLGITGIVLASVAGFVAGALVFGPRGAGEELGSDRYEFALLWAAGASAGVGLAVGGFSLAAAGRAPSMDIQRLPTPGQPRGSTGAGVSFTGTF